MTHFFLFLCGIDRKIPNKWLIFVKYVINISNLRVDINILNQFFMTNLINVSILILTIENPNMNDVDSIFHSHVTEHENF